MAKKSKNNNPRNLGIEGIEPVARKVDGSKDPKCPFNGSVKLRGKSFIGTVSSDKMHKTATVFWERTLFVSKFERYEKRLTKIHCHNPESIDAKQGDKVLIMETRPLSKTKKFVIIKILGKDIDYKIKDQLIKDDEKKAKLEKDASKEKADIRKSKQVEMDESDEDSNDEDSSEDNLSDDQEVSDDELSNEEDSETNKKSDSEDFGSDDKED